MKLLPGICLCITAVYLSCFIALTPAPAGAEDNAEKSVQILVLRNKPFGITPEKATVAKGTTLVWYNKDTEPVTITFIEPLGPSCKVSSNFHSTLQGNFTTGLIPQSGIASLCIVLPGTYEYDVRRLVAKGSEKPAEEVTRGTIIVK